MLLFQKFLLGISVGTLLVGITALFFFFKNKKKNITDDPFFERNQNLNLFIAIVFLLGSLLVGLLIPFVG